MSSSRKIVLQTFKNLHRTRMRVFEGDTRALSAARLKINEEFKKNKHVSNQAAIDTMIQLGTDVERELRTQVIQAKEVRPGVFEAKITSETVKLDNIPYDDRAVQPDGAPGARACCQDQAQNK